MESQKLHHCPAVTGVTPHPVVSGEPTRGAVLRYLSLSQKERFQCGPDRKLNSFPTLGELRSTFPH